jgi:uncharacterized protein (TIGR03067 family)
MRRRLLPLLALVVLLLSLAFAPAPLPRAPRRGKADPGMEGVWYGFQRLEVTPARLTYFSVNASAAYELRMDRAARTYDIVEITGNRRFLGIYKVEGDKLTICYREPEKGRPTTFEGPYLEVFDRRLGGGAGP